MKKFKELEKNFDERLKRSSELLKKYSYPWTLVMTIFVLGMLLRFITELNRTGWYNITTFVVFSIVLVLMFTVTFITLYGTIATFVEFNKKQKEKKKEQEE